MKSARRSLGVVGAAIVLLLVAAGCDPVPPDIVITVDDPTQPSGGPCTTSGDTGRCPSLSAAIGLGNELSTSQEMRRVTLEIPGHPQLDIYLGSPVITGNLRIVVDRPSSFFYAEVTFATLTVAEGATLDIDVDRIDRPGCDGGFCPQLGETKLDVDGTLIVRSTPINEGGWSIIRVNEGGTAVLIDSVLTGSLYWGEDMQGDGSQAILNAGTLLLVRSQVSVSGVLGAVTTLGAGTTYMKDSSISAPARAGIPGSTDPWGPLPAGAGDACGGTLPVSLGGNWAFDETCQLTGPGDVNGPATPP